MNNFARMSGLSKNRLKNIANPYAIAMWDFSWLLRHHKMGEFENWDKVLDELAERGYNAVRIDCFPQLIASDNEGKIKDIFECQKPDWSPAFWGNQYTVKINPREALLEFLPKCKARGIYVGLSSWFLAHADNRSEIFQDKSGLIRAWDETLQFLDVNNLLDDNIIYVDILNEYPLNNGFSWIRKAMIADEKGTKIDDIAIDNVGNEHLWSPDKGTFSTVFHKKFMNEVITALSARWKDMNFFVSLTPYKDDMDWSQMADFSTLSILDMHIWFVLNQDFSNETLYWQNIHSAHNDIKYAESFNLISVFWKSERSKMITWMRNRMQKVADLSRKFDIPYGNTEGWGAIIWNEHPSLDWEFIKDSAEICAVIGADLGYSFNCTSNFTHPHFPGFWDDIKWHKKVTSIIKKS